MTTQLRIGTRASPLARAQAHMAAEALGLPDATLAAMQTEGDRENARPLRDWGFKGLFTRELDDALLNNHVDIAVHSMKDMPSELPEGIMVGAVLPRADVRDGWISTRYPSLDDLPKGAVVGTSSLRRAAQLRAHRADIEVVEFRGNVQTRLQKLADGVADATLLACAGLDRLGLADHITQRLSTNIMLPAAAQGIIAIACRADDIATLSLLAAVHHATTNYAATAERAMLHVLDGSCRTPIAGLATLDGDMLTLTGALYAEDGSQTISKTATAPVADAQTLGKEIGHAIRANAPTSMLSKKQ